EACHAICVDPNPEKVAVPSARCRRNARDGRASRGGGPDALLDGIWFVQETGPGGGPPTFYASIHQTGSTVVAILIRLDDQWTYAVGTRSGSTVQGTVFFLDGQPF